MIHIYTGCGKGKTSAALGLGLRALGSGKKVLLIQFLKNGSSSEVRVIKKYLPKFEVKSFGRKGFLDKNGLKKQDYQLAEQGFNLAKKAVHSRKYEIIILDEINVALNLGLLKISGLIELIKIVPQDKELILTGRRASKKILKYADLITEMKEVKHYFKKGIKARKGIEY